eukprot:362274-Chlamydomonas_euryale.AAC.4
MNIPLRVSYEDLRCNFERDSQWEADNVKRRPLHSDTMMLQDAGRPFQTWRCCKFCSRAARMNANSDCATQPQFWTAYAHACAARMLCEKDAPARMGTFKKKHAILGEILPCIVCRRLCTIFLISVWRSRVKNGRLATLLWAYDYSLYPTTKQMSSGGATLLQSTGGMQHKQRDCRAERKAIMLQQGLRHDWLERWHLAWACGLKEFRLNPRTAPLGGLFPCLMQPQRWPADPV